MTKRVAFRTLVHRNSLNFVGDSLVFSIEEVDWGTGPTSLKGVVHTDLASRITLSGTGQGTVDVLNPQTASVHLQYEMDGMAINYIVGLEYTQQPRRCISYAR